jgi:predicted nuclease of predicted toxin-antitoxin system
MKIAIDTCISIRTKEALEKVGHEVVCIASMSEHDEDWVSRAILSGAQVIVSSDLDIPNLLDRYDSGMIWLELPQGKINQFNFIIQSLKHFRGMLERDSL